MNTLCSMQSIRHTVLGLALTCLFALSPAHAETTNCTAITSLPYTITTQGVYCFTGNLGTGMTSGNAITVNANNVTIDMNGFKLGGLAAGAGTTATGFFSDKRKNITIRNGIIRGFQYGIFINDDTPYTTSQGHLIEDIVLDQNRWAGVSAEGQGMTIRRNKVFATGGSTLMGLNNTFGIIVFGPGNEVLDNRVFKTTETTGAASWGIYLTSGQNSVLERNTVSDTTATNFGYGFFIEGSNDVTVRENSVTTTAAGISSYGFYINSSSDVLVRNNIIVSAANGIFYTGSGSGLYQGNSTSNVTTPFTGGTPAGSSNYTNP